MVDKVIQAWKDPKFRAGLSAAELATLPAHPAGESWHELSEREIAGLVGGAQSVELPPTTWGNVSNCGSCGYICTATTECPWFTLCC